MEARGAAVRGTDLSLARWERGSGQRDRRLPLNERLNLGTRSRGFCVPISPLRIGSHNTWHNTCLCAELDG
jgi:hypothetical protein